MLRDMVRGCIALGCIVLGYTVLALVNGAVLPAQDRETRVRSDRVRFERDDRWTYNDLPAALAQGRDTGKPLLVVLRCIPCEACSQFDQQVIEEQNDLSDLLDRFVCARIVHMNGLDLSLFQFDFDQSFHALMMNADQVIYGRFGTRSHRPEEEDMTLAGFRAALEGALELHANYPANRDALTGKRKTASSVERPELFPSLEGKYGPQLDYEGKVVQSCIHCHQVRDAERLVYREAGKAIPAQLLYPYPLPDVIGLEMHADERATIARVTEDSISARAGLRAGDRLLELGGQPLISTADIQWVLHHADDAAPLAAVIQRDGQQQTVTIALPSRWRTASDISWRPTTWDLRRMALGGLVAETMPDTERPDGIRPSQLALRIKHVGQYGEHAVAMRAGFKKGDVITAVDGRTAPLTETQLIAYGLTKRPGEKLRFRIRRGAAEAELSFAVQ